MGHITQAELHELFEYKDGQLVNRIYRHKSPKGKVIGYIDGSGYLTARVKCKTYRVHRLIYLYHHGYLPKNLDHRDTVKLNNLTENLRPCSNSQNSFNSKKPVTNTSGIKGVCWYKHVKKWGARIRVAGKQIHLGYYADIKEAGKVIRAAREKHHGEFCRYQ